MNMTIIQRYKIRKSLIKKYKEKVATCRYMASKLSLKDISTKFDASTTDPCVCFDVKMSQQENGANEVMPVVKYCEHFGKDVCPAYKCPYRANYQEYKNREKLLNLEIKEKHMAFKRIFQRIR